jgi:GNAT superfamily N-acetyltransferase
MLEVTIVTSDDELEQILQLQKRNLIGNIDMAEIQSQGFVTVDHSPEVLLQMHQLAPSVIIKDDHKVVAYALVMLRECRDLVPTLQPMFVNLDQLAWKGKPLNDYKFYVMGQVCVDKDYRGKGLFDLLYQKHKEIYHDQYDFVITEVSTRNHRSIRAHERVGFETINIYRDELDEWAVVILNFKC